MRWYRKHQKKMLVFFGVILMTLFVLGSAMPWLGSGSGPDFRSNANEEAKQTVVSWNSGKLTRGDMARMAALHFATMRFQNQLFQQARQNNASWTGPPIQFIQPIAGDPQSEEFQRSLFGRYLLAHYGREKLDLVISPNVIDEYIFWISDGQSLSDQDWYNLNEVANRGAFDYRDIQEYMKMELAAMRVDDLLSTSLPFQGLQSDPRRAQPADFGNTLDQFLAYLQTEKRFECSVLPFKVSDYISQVSGEPSATEIRQIFDAGRYMEPGEQFEKPGFKRSRKVSVEFLRGDQQTFVDLAIQGVTKEEVLAEYNRLVEAKDPLVMEDVPAAVLPGEPATPPGENLQDPAPQPASGEDGANPTSGAEQPEMKPAEGADAKTDPAPAPPDASDPSGGGDPDPAKADAPDTSDPDGGEAKGEAKEEGGGGPRAMIQEPGEDPAPAPQDAGNDSPSAPDNSTQEKPAQEEPAQEKPTQEEPADKETAPEQPAVAPPQEPAAGEMKPAEAAQSQPGAEAAAPAEQPLLPALGAQEPTIPEPEKRAKPLDDALELRIKQRLKSEEATKAFETAMENAFFDMSDYQVLLADYEASLNDPEGEKVDKPAALDLKALADKYHMTYGSVQSADFETLRGSELGQAIEFDRQNGRIVGGAEVIFGNFDKLTPFYPTKIGGNFLYWVTEKKPAYVPNADEARAEVVQYWKEQQAYALAEAAAQKALDELRTAGQTLLEKYPEQAKQTGEFAWFSQTPPLAIEQPGPELLDTAYQLPANELAVAPNADRSILYLLQKTKDDPRTLDELREAFFKNIATFKQPYSTGVPRYFAQQSVRDWVDHVNEQLGVRWEGF